MPDAERHLLNEPPSPPTAHAAAPELAGPPPPAALAPPPPSLQEESPAVYPLRGALLWAAVVVTVNALPGLLLLPMGDSEWKRTVLVVFTSFLAATLAVAATRPARRLLARDHVRSGLITLLLRFVTVLPCAALDVLLAGLVGAVDVDMDEGDFGLKLALAGGFIYAALVTLLFWSLAALLAWRYYLDAPQRPQRPQHSGRCRICGYDLRATPRRCPECGTPASPGQPAPPAPPGPLRFDAAGRTYPAARFFPCYCPRCGPPLRGQMRIARRGDSGRLCFSCALCGWTCDQPEDLDAVGLGYEGSQLPLAAPTRAEIEQAGWGRYCGGVAYEDLGELRAVPDRGKG